MKSLEVFHLNFANTSHPFGLKEKEKRKGEYKALL